ncbi:type III polyketide synthase [Kineococcus sp. SYSU DK001]|uniref:type III polyketide synthase n=1 Tax=Kineococcus sp. SYSU DK001 TaxID=3383122 RepID=UPI003D7CC3BD
MSTPTPSPPPSAATVVAVEPVLPAHRYAQSEIAEVLAPLLTDPGPGRSLLHRLHAATGVRARHLALPLETYPDLVSGPGAFDTTNALFADLALDLAERAVKGALATAGLEPHDVDVLLFTTVTGVGAPSVDALLPDRVGLRPDVLRWPGFGLGCVAGASGLALLERFCAGRPGAVGLLVSVELCSLTLQAGDRSVANVVASGLFGDGATAVVVTGPGHPGPGWRVLDHTSRVLPDSADDLGWRVGSSGLRIVLSAQLPQVLARHVGHDLRAFLPDGGGVDRWVVHPGGPKVLDAVAAAADLPPGALDTSREVLRECGNLSSSAVLHVLARTAADPGQRAVVLGVGPGVTTQTVLLERV